MGYVPHKHAQHDMCACVKLSLACDMLTSPHMTMHELRAVHVCRYLFSTTGLRACSYMTAVAGVYSIVFTVTNSKGASSSVTRTLVVQPVCSYGEVLCPNKVGSTPSAHCHVHAADMPTRLAVLIMSRHTSLLYIDAFYRQPSLASHCTRTLQRR